MLGQFEFAIVSGVSETEIQQIKKNYITDRIRESVDIFGSQPEHLGSVIMTAVTALALLISKVLDKTRELSAKFFEKGLLQAVAEPSEGRTTQIIPQTDNPPKQETSEIPSKPVMSADAAAKTAYDGYRDKSDKWEERYGKAAHRQEKESVHNRLQNYQRENADQHIRQTSKNMDKGAR